MADNGWDIAAWQTDTWDWDWWDSIIYPQWKDGLYLMVDMGGGVVYLRQL